MYFLIFTSNETLLNEIKRNLYQSFSNAKIVSISDYNLLFSLSYKKTKCIVFMGIESLDFENLRKINRISTKTKFIYFGPKSQWSFKLYDTYHISYITTPIKDSEIKKFALRAYRESKNNDTFSYSFNKVRYMIDVDEIAYFNSFGKHTIIVCKDANEISFISKLGDVEKQLNDSFIRCHKSFIVNISTIVSVDRHNVRVKLNDSEYEIPISRSRYKSFFKAYANYFHN